MIKKILIFILIVVILLEIVLGIGMYKKVQDAKKNVKRIDANNYAIEQYIGKDNIINGEDLKALIYRINAGNRLYAFKSEITINDLSNIGFEKNKSGEYITDNIKDFSDYEILLKYDDDDFISEVSIKLIDE